MSRIVTKVTAKIRLAPKATVTMKPQESKQSPERRISKRVVKVKRQNDFIYEQGGVNNNAQVSLQFSKTNSQGAQKAEKGQKKNSETRSNSNKLKQGTSTSKINKALFDGIQVSVNSDVEDELLDYENDVLLMKMVA